MSKSASFSARSLSLLSLTHRSRFVDYERIGAEEMRYGDVIILCPSHLLLVCMRYIIRIFPRLPLSLLSPSSLSPLPRTCFTTRCFHRMATPNIAVHIEYWSVEGGQSVRVWCCVCVIVYCVRGVERRGWTGFSSQPLLFYHIYYVSFILYTVGDEGMYTHRWC